MKTVADSIELQQSIKQVLEDLNTLNEARAIAARYGNAFVRIDHTGKIEIVSNKDIAITYMRNEGLL